MDSIKSSTQIYEEYVCMFYSPAVYIDCCDYSGAEFQREVKGTEF